VHGIHSRFALLALLGLTIAAVAGISVSVAAAGSAACSYTGSLAYVCTYVDGYDNYVTHVGVVRGKSIRTSSAICNYRGLMEIRAPSGALLDHRWSPLHRGCSSSRAWFDWYPRRFYPDSSKVCTYFYGNYWTLQGTACKTIHS
jgi:hypothetical protein